MINQIGKCQQWIEQEIKKNKYGKQPESLYEPIRYLMNLGGKRLRPMLTLLSYSLYKDDVKSIIPYAVAVEAFHNFTLMHDDIMDKAPLRRGKSTVHKKWNVNTAILSGDVMLVKVYEAFNELEPSTLKTVLKSFNKCAAEVCEGQQWDMEYESHATVTEAEYINMIKLKTSVLLGFSLELGAILAGASDEDRKTLYQFGVNIGIGFQLKDDLLDAYADPKKFGKQVGGDIIANKKTWLLIKALEKAQGKEKKELQHWLAAKTFKKKEKVTAIKVIYDKLNIPTLAERKVNQYFDKGLKELDKLHTSSSSKAFLKTFTENLIARQS
ncbi:MAG TPA: polyprenyl synthetase family protein [Cyclobacteriaceae bacterium]|jgi:geranylgeranyl diphosphate synthase type II|nr:polyprenyl synthetase family protein [Cyclobacteriaceae bacterium]